MMIIEYLNTYKPVREIKEALETNFDMSAQDAEEYIIKVLSDLQVEQDAFESKKMVIKTNPGFPILIIKDKFK